jgi:hypothetical protein
MVVCGLLCSMCLQDYVFCKVVRDITDVTLNPDVPPENYRAGDMMVARYAQIREYVMDGKLLLI